MKKVFTFALLLFTIVIFPQKDFKGKAVYMSKATMDMSSWGRSAQMSEQQKKQIAERMKSMLEKTFILSFNKTESIYKEDAKLESPVGGRGFRFGGMFGGGTQYKNNKENVALEAIEFLGEKFLISDTMEPPKWELGSETKQIGNYIAIKATMTKKIDATDWSNFRRRGRGRNGNTNKEKTKKDSTKTTKISEEIEVPNEIVVTAWYTPQIPVNTGPGEFWGLPGLILEVSYGRTTILCTEIVINPTEDNEINKPTKGKKISREKYSEVVKVKMEEMRERFRNRSRGTGRRH